MQKKSITKALRFERLEIVIRVSWSLGLLSSPSSYTKAGKSAGERKVSGRPETGGGSWWKVTEGAVAETEAM